MKALSLILLTILMAKGCSQESKNDLANAQIVYTAYSRGFFLKTTIQNHQLFITNKRGDESKGDSIVISDSDWKELVNDFKTIELDSLATYKDPTQKRFYDGAAIANLKVAYKDKEYQTLDFDHKFPPVEIEKLVNKIVELGKKE